MFEHTVKYEGDNDNWSGEVFELIEHWKNRLDRERLARQLPFKERQARDQCGVFSSMDAFEEIRKRLGIRSETDE